MKKAIAIAGTVAALIIIAITYLLYNSISIDEKRANYSKTAAARSARWRKRGQDDFIDGDEDEEDEDFDNADSKGIIHEPITNPNYEQGNKQGVI